MVFPKTLRSGSFRLKLIVAVMACILIPTSITLLVSNVVTERAMKEQAVTNAKNTLQLVDGYVSKLLDFMLYALNYIQVDAEINVVLREQASGSAADKLAYKRFYDEYYTVIKKLDNLSMAGGEKFFITILLPNGKFYTNYPRDEYDPVLWFEEPLFDQLRNLRGFETFWAGSRTTVFRSHMTNHPYQLTVARPLRNSRGEIYAYAIVTMLEDEISSIFRQLADGREIVLIDGAGKILSHTDHGKIGTELPFAPPETTGIIRHDGDHYLVVRQKLQYADWSLVLLAPYRESLARLPNYNRAVYLILFASFFTFMLLLIFLIERFSRPLRHLGRVAEIVQRGNLQVRSHIRGNDEIGYLGTSFDQMLDRINEMIREITEEQIKKRQAELAMLQAQINPHFLFNVLNSIRLNILRKGDQENAEVIGSLSRLLRMTIGQDHEQISLREEIELVSHYVRLMNMRRKEKARLILDIPEEALTERVPRFFLQPVIENALIHGLKHGEGTIRVGVRPERNRLVISVEDDGAGMDDVFLQKLKAAIHSADGTGAKEIEPRRGFSGIGLSNVYERMCIIYGKSFSMEIASEINRGTTVTFIIPRMEVLEGHVQSHVG